jgi:hypothetical protein
MDNAHYARGPTHQHMSLEESVRRTNEALHIQRHDASGRCILKHMRKGAHIHGGFFMLAYSWKSGKSSLIWNHAQANPTVDDAI